MTITFVHFVKKFVNSLSSTSHQNLPSFRSNELLPFAWVYILPTSFARPLIHSAFYRALFAVEWIDDPLLKETRSTVSTSSSARRRWTERDGHRQWTTAIRANIFEKCIDVITKQVFTSFHSRFIRYS